MQGAHRSISEHLYAAASAEASPDAEYLGSLLFGFDFELSEKK